MRNSEDDCKAQADGKVLVPDMQGRAFAVQKEQLPAFAEDTNIKSDSEKIKAKSFRAEPAFYLRGLEKLSECFRGADGGDRD